MRACSSMTPNSSSNEKLIIPNLPGLEPEINLNCASAAEESMAYKFSGL